MALVHMIYHIVLVTFEGAATVKIHVFRMRNKTMHKKKDSSRKGFVSVYCLQDNIVPYWPGAIDHLISELPAVDSPKQIFVVMNS